eukprot:gene7361-11683_t
MSIEDEPSVLDVCWTMTLCSCVTVFCCCPCLVVLLAVLLPVYVILPPVPLIFLAWSKSVVNAGTFDFFGGEIDHISSHDVDSRIDQAIWNCEDCLWDDFWIIFCECGETGRSRALMWCLFLSLFGWAPAVIFSLGLSVWAYYCVMYEWAYISKNSHHDDIEYHSVQN